MTTQTATQSSLRLPALLLAITPLLFVGVLVAGALGFASKVTTTFDQITPDVMATIRLPWTMLYCILFGANLSAITGLTLLSKELKNTKHRLLAWLTIGLALADLVILVTDVYLRLTMTNFSEATLGQTSQWQISRALVYYAYLLRLATIFTASLGLYLSGWLRRTGLVVCVVSGLLFIAALVPNINRSIPPFVFSFFWLSLGLGLLRRRST